MAENKRTPKPANTLDPLNKHPDKKPDEKLLKSNKSSKKPDQLLIFTLCLALVATISTLAFFAIIFNYFTDLTASRNNRNSLLDLAENIEEQKISAFDAEMRQINNDYMCWITIDGTTIDYPVMRGNDNEKYLNLSFHGEENIFGTLFMDYRNKGEYVPNIIIFGHNIKTGEMFGGLRNFLNDQYMEEHPIITIKVNDRIIEYEIFAARKTDVTDPAYYLDFSASGAFKAFAKRCGAPSDAKQIITLSTCVSGDYNDERVIVQGALR